MSSQYFINQTDVSSALLPRDSLGSYCRTNPDNTAINLDPGLVGSDLYISNNNFYVLYDSSSGWILYDNISGLQIAHSSNSNAGPTNIDWYLGGVNIGEIVINGTYPAFPRIGGRLRLQCIRCPVGGGLCNNFTYEDLAERRKAHILANNNNNMSNKLSVAKQIQNRRGSRVWASQTLTDTNPNVQNLVRPLGTNILIYKSNLVDASGNLTVDASGNFTDRIGNKCNNSCSIVHAVKCGAQLCLDPDVPYTK
jgi:hypothetical protein